MSGNSDSRPVVTPWRAVVVTSLRVIFFRASQFELIQVNGRHLVLGLACTWLVGMGRYWDNPRVGWLQHLGVGSVVYVFILSLFLCLIIWPLGPRNWSYFRVLTFVSLVSPPAILYAIPVEKFVSLATANSVNAMFLLIVASWRVALLIFLLKRVGELKWPSMVVATLLPLTLIVVTLSVLNLDKVVLDLMGGIQNPSPNDAAYAVLLMLSYFSILMFVPLVITYAIIVALRLAASRRSAI